MIRFLAQPVYSMDFGRQYNWSEEATTNESLLEKTSHACHEPCDLGKILDERGSARSNSGKQHEVGAVTLVTTPVFHAVHCSINQRFVQIAK
ncbi:MAG: hypothetical protein ACR2OA_21770 [Rubripirellula sp.]